MNVERALRIREEAVIKITSLFSTAKHFGWSHSFMLEKRNTIYAELKVCKTPRWVRDYLCGYWAALQSKAYETDLVYGAMVDGQFYSTHHNRPDYYETNGIEPKAFAQDNPTKGHYWAENLKPFFVSSD